MTTIKQWMNKYIFIIAGIFSLLCFVSSMLICANKPNGSFVDEEVTISDDGTATFAASRANMISIHLKMSLSNVIDADTLHLSVSDEAGTVLAQTDKAWSEDDIDEDGVVTWDEDKFDFAAQENSAGQIYTMTATLGSGDISEYLDDSNISFSIAYEIVSYNKYIVLMCAIYIILFALYMYFVIKNVRRSESEEVNGVAWFALHMIILVLVAVTFAKQFTDGIWDLYIVSIHTAEAIFILLIDFIWMLCKRRKQPELQRIFLILAISSGCLLHLVLPVGIVPDEQQHAYSAYYVASVLMGKQGELDAVQVRQCELDEYIMNAMSRGYFNEQCADIFDSVGDETYVDSHFSRNRIYNPHWSAIVPALGIIFARLLHMNAFWTLMFGNLFATLFYALVMAYAMKKIPVGKYFLFAISFFPMMQQQVNSYSHDNVILCACALVFAIGLSWCYESPQKIRWQDIVLYLVSAFALCRIKGGTYAVFALIPILFHHSGIRRREWLRENRWKVLLAFAAFVLCMFWSQISGLILTDNGRVVGGSGNYIVWAETYSYSISDFVNNPKQLVYILGHTINQRLDFYFTGAISSNMGWIQYSAPIYVLVCFVVVALFAISVDARRESNLITKSDLYIGVILAFITCGFCAAGLLLDYTPVTSNVIEGIQGRYFLPEIILVGILACRCKLVRANEKGETIVPIAVAFMECFALGTIANLFI